jgi:hypothetical protein
MSSHEDEQRPLARAASDGYAPLVGRRLDDVHALAQVSGAGAEPAGPVPRAMTLRVLLRYKWSILFVFLGLAVMATACVWMAFVPRYKATAMIEVSPVIPQLLAGKSDMVPLYESYRGGQADYLTSPIVLKGVLENPEVQATNWYRATPVTPIESLLTRLGLRHAGPALDRLTDALQPEVPKGKQLIYVSMTTTTRGEAKLIVDKVLAE